MQKQAVIIGAGPAGLMAAEVLSAANIAVSVYEKMPSPARKFLMAGRGGLNLTHSEAMPAFLSRYGAAEDFLKEPLRQFSPADLRRWCEGLQQPTFIGSSGRVFPTAFKASPLLRAWLRRLEKQGVGFHLRREWKGWDAHGALVFEAPGGRQEPATPDATLLALGGASWPRLGADGSWAAFLRQETIAVAEFRPANCGFEVAWSDIFKQRFEGQPLKPLALSFGDNHAQGEAVITRHGIEGGAVYALSSFLREALAGNGYAEVLVDVAPGRSEQALLARFGKVPRGRQSLSGYLKKSLGLSPVTIGLVHEISRHDRLPLENPLALATLLKRMPLHLTAPFPLQRAISSAGGVCRGALNGDFMLRQKPGVFAAGEMLDWEAPTGGYLLQASFSTGVAAAHGMLRYLNGGGPSVKNKPPVQG